MDNNEKPSSKLRILLIVFLIWNFMGIIAFITDMSTDPNTLSAIDLEFSKHFPLWTKAIYGLAVITGTLGTLGLLMRKRWAKTTLGISLLCVIIQMYHSLFIAGAIEVYGTAVVIMPIIVLTVSIVLFRIAQKMHR